DAPAYWKRTAKQSAATARITAACFVQPPQCSITPCAACRNLEAKASLLCCAHEWTQTAPAMTQLTDLPQLAALEAADRAHLIHPVSPWRAHEQRGPTVLSSGRGAWLTDANGHEVLDAFAGLWCVNVGYGQECVVQAAAEQMRRLPYATGYF